MGNPTESERKFLAAITKDLAPTDRVLQNIRLSDSDGGDVEIDFVILLPNHGIAVVEVKGGQVSYQDGEWILQDRSRSRRIHPIEQARRGKHALRRFLARQPEWTHGLPVAEWFLVLPNTEVLGDVGPEGRRELLFGAGEIEGSLARIKQVLDSLPRPEHRLTEAEVTEAEALLRGRTDNSRTSSTPNSWSTTRKVSLIAIGAIAIAAGTFATVGMVNASKCSTAYEPCIPEGRDVDCAEIDFGVLVKDESDPFGLDRDGDGVACESNATPDELAELRAKAAAQQQP